MDETVGAKDGSSIVRAAVGVEDDLNVGKAAGLRVECASIGESVGS